MELGKNQILLTLSEDKRVLKVESGASAISIDFDSCPNHPVDSIERAIEAFANVTRLNVSKEWSPDGCGYEGSGDCKRCKNFTMF